MKYAPSHLHAFVGYRKHSFSTHMLLLSCFSCVQLFATLWTVTNQTPLSKGFSRQKYWSGLPCPPPGDLPGPGIELTSQAGSLPLAPPGKPFIDHKRLKLTSQIKFSSILKQAFKRCPIYITETVDINFK